jgi:hypothetical protein
MKRPSRAAASITGSDGDGALLQQSCGSPVMTSILRREKGRSSKSAFERLGKDISKIPSITATACDLRRVRSPASFPDSI